MNLNLLVIIATVNNIVALYKVTVFGILKDYPNMFAYVVSSVGWAFLVHKASKKQEG